MSESGAVPERSQAWTPQWCDNLRTHLALLVARPAVKSDLRSGLRRTPADSLRMHRHVARFVPDRLLGTSRETAVYTTASIAGAWPELLADTSGRSVGAALGQLARSSGGWSERRLHQLCRSELTDLPTRLASAVPQLVAERATFDLAALARDLDRWDISRADVVRRWVREYDLAEFPPATPETPSDITNQKDPI